MLGEIQTPKANNLLAAYKFLARSIGVSGVVAGQSMDISNYDIKNLADLNNLHNLKTGKLIQASGLIPLILHGFKPQDEIFNLITNYSHALGLAFQIQDDVLNLIGEVGQYGKEIAGDISEGKRTLVLIHLFGTCTKAEASRIIEIMNNFLKQTQHFPPLFKTNEP